MLNQLCCKGGLTTFGHLCTHNDWCNCSSHLDVGYIEPNTWGESTINTWLKNSDHHTLPTHIVVPFMPDLDFTALGSVYSPRDINTISPHVAAKYDVRQGCRYVYELSFSSIVGRLFAQLRAPPNREVVRRRRGHLGVGRARPQLARGQPEPCLHIRRIQEPQVPMSDLFTLVSKLAFFADKRSIIGKSSLSE